jgi:glycosyltransferase involved in cell wall biosynthesis
MKPSALIYAPNINTGGGLVLLKSILNSWPEELAFHAFLDARIRNTILLPATNTIHWVEANAFARILSSIKLKKISSNYDNILMFHGLPPIFSLKPKVIVFLQNKNYFGLNPLKEFPIKVAFRLFIERTICRFFKSHVDEYIVQTPTMARDLIAWYGRNANKKLISIFPFNDEIIQKKNELLQKWDLIYVSDGAAHKNHLKLIDALIYLSKEKIFPSLAITLGKRDAKLLATITGIAKQHKLNIHNIGNLPHEEVLDALNNSGALVFPSKMESFGLPLIEASHFRIPIIASELDYVRDVCVPDVSFDPNSEVSIARAIKRHLGHTDSPNKIGSALSFIKKITE